MKRRNSMLFACLLGLAILYVFWDLRRPFNETDDFWSAQITTQMLASGDWVIPHFGPEADYNKPPLFYWLSLPAVAGVSDLEAAMRLVPGLAFCALLCLIYAGVGGNRTAIGIGSAAIAALTYDHLHVHGFRSAVPDGLLTLEITAVLILVWQRRQRPRAWLAIGALIGAAFMTKTVLAIVPLAIAATGLWLDRSDAPVRSREVLGMLLVAAAVVVPWFAIALAREGYALVDHMFLDQVLGRLTNSAAAAASGRAFGRTEPLYVLRHYLTWGQPWSLLAAPSFLLLWLRRRELAPDHQRLCVLCAVWFFGLIASMSASRAAWGWYVASAHVPAAIAVALALRIFLRPSPGRQEAWLWAPIAASFLMVEVLLRYDPYVGTSGRVPLDPVLMNQLVAASLLGVLLVRWRHPAERPTPRTLLAGIPLAIAASLAARALGSGSWAQLFQFSAFALAVSVALRFDGPAARGAAVLATGLVAVGYLLSPLRHSSGDRGEADVPEIRRVIASDAFQGGRALIAPGNQYTYVRIYQIFADEIDVRYDRSRQVLRLSRRVEP